MRATIVPVMVVCIQALALVAAAVVCGSSPAMIPLCWMAYVLGLRHALDADHIAAIDNVSRNLVGRGEPATGVGLFFALGHSGAVTAASVGVSLAASRMSAAVEHATTWTAMCSTLISMAVLLAVAPANARTAWHSFRHAGSSVSSSSRTSMRGGWVSRLMAPILRLRIRSWQMLIIGALFGLGFETATAIAVLGLSATQVGNGSSLATAMVFPLLFTAGMTLVDALDGMFMERAYGWAVRDPSRQAKYNLVVTSLSASIALLVGATELASLMGRVSSVTQPVASAVELVETHFEQIGATIIGVFAVCWLLALILSRALRRRPSASALAVGLLITLVSLAYTPGASAEGVTVSDANLKAVRAFYDFWNTGNASLLKESLAATFTDQTLPPGRPQGPEGPSFASRQFRAAVPDLQVQVEKMLWSGEYVTVHMVFTGHFSGTFGKTRGGGQPVRFVATDLLRVRDGRVTDNWHIEDNLTLFTQMGVVKMNP